MRAADGRDGEQPSLVRRLLNFFAMLFGTDINRRLGDTVAGKECSVVSDEPSLVGGLYRVVLPRRS